MEKKPSFKKKLGLSTSIKKTKFLKKRELSAYIYIYSNSKKIKNNTLDITI